ncbi:TIGR03503 family protein [Alteromonas sp. CYL-A6]|uniref:TIGR03503 family protein n=1 Tax=Alteromonas nitratireducens TaxID=3390813 RepID=UPI0034ACFDF6
MTKFGSLLTALLFSTGVFALQQTDEAGQAQGDSAPVVSPISTLGSEYENAIELLKNRFRIDYKVDEVTMVFFREYGSVPVVLVRPDGSKIFQSQVDNEDKEGRIQWFDAETYDMVRIKNPVPGPWQAVGRILPNSRVMVVSDIELHADPLPPIVFSGEILKSTAYLTNAGEAIEDAEFRDVVELTIELISTNNPNFDNFGADSQLIATFQDNGRGMDEAPLDGVFTGQFNLSIAPGEWRPVFRVSTPLFSREQQTELLRLYPNPVSVNAEVNGGGDGYHKLVIDVDRDLVDISSLLVDGKVRFPNGDIQNFSLTKPSDNVREHLIAAYEEGIFRVKLTAYGTTKNGRDFILDVPEYTFLAEAPEPEIIDPLVADMSTGTMPEETVSDALMPDAQNAVPVTPAPAERPPEDEMDTRTLVTLLVAVNGSILLVGGMVIGIVMLRKRAARSATARAEDAGEVPKTGLVDKLRRLLPLGKKKQDNDEV